MFNPFTRGTRHPECPLDMPVATTLSTQLLDAASEECAMVFQVPKTGTITHVGWQTATVTTADDVVVSLGAVSATTGAPSDAVYGGSVGTTVVLADADDDTYFETLLATPATAVKGEIVALRVTLTYVNGSLSIAAYPAAKMTFPYVATYLAAAWSLDASKMICYVKYSDGTYFSPGIPGRNATVAFKSDDTVNDEFGIRLVFPHKMKASGFWGIIDADQGFRVKLYDAGGTVLATTALYDKDQRTGSAIGYFEGEFNDDVIILPNTEYILAVVPAITSTVGLSVLTVKSNAVLDCLSYGRECYQMSRVDASTWSHSKTKRPMLGLIASI